MTINIGVYTTVAYKPETTFGTIPAASGAQLIRRRAAKLEFSKATFESPEIRPDMQVNDFRHGLRSAKGTLQQDLSPKSGADFFAAVMGRDFAAGASSAALSLTMATGALVNGIQLYTVTRSAGSYLTDGFKIGDVIRLSVGGLNAANINKNLQITSLTATIATVRVVNGSAMVAEGPISGCTVAVPGKKTFIPSTAQTNKSFSIEAFASDIVQSEVYSGMKVAKAAVNCPSTGLSDVTFEFAGQGMTPAASQYFTSPTAAPTFASEAGVNGAICVNDQPQITVTGINFTIERAMTGDAVVGSFVAPQINPGLFKVTGTMTVLYSDNVLRDLFVNEAETDVYLVLSCDNTAAADFVAFTMPRVKLNSAAKDDKIQNIVQTITFQALFNNNGGAGVNEELTTISMQDTQA
jgi:hypothetical protein